ncbi:MAG: fibronectin type III domain-containing protein, partial [Candidatus Bathycorpusculaceae bacterium]
MPFTFEYYDSGSATWKSLKAVLEKLTEELNGHEECEFYLANNSTNRGIVGSNVKVRLLWGTTVVWSGVLYKVVYGREILRCYAYNQAYEIMKSKVIDATYSGATPSAILQGIANAAGVVAGSAPTTPTRSVRFRKALCYDALEYLASMINKDFWGDYDSSGNPRINIGTKGVSRGTVTPISYPERGVDRGKKRDKVIIRGFDANGNEIEGTAGTGTNVAVFTENRAATVDELNTLAQKKLAELNKESSGLKISIKISVGYNFTAGDTVDINMPDLNLVGTYRVFRITKTNKECILEIDKEVELISKIFEKLRELEDKGIYVYDYAPATPTGLTVTLLSDASGARFSWNANTEKDLEGYYVYVDTVTPPATKVATVSQPNYIWQGDLSVTHYVAVSAFDKGGNESDKTSAVAFSKSAPSTPTGLTVSYDGQGGFVTISWNEIKGLDIDHYNLYIDTVNPPTALYAKVKGTKVQLPPLPDIVRGLHYVAVSAVDVLGVEGSKCAAVTLQDTTAPATPTSAVSATAV